MTPTTTIPADRGHRIPPIGTRITSFRLHGRWANGEEISEPFDDMAEAFDSAYVCEQGGATRVVIERRIERIVRTELESAETIYGKD